MDTVRTQTDKNIPQTFWVQCDNTYCMKWRRITNKEAKLITDETKWYCYLNEDTYHNKCDDPEEDFESAEDLEKKYGAKYITSPFCEGELVWAKVPGYCRWPAIVCKDPDVGESSFQSIDGDTLSYHVEFLGKKRCHGLVRAPLVTGYVRDIRQPALSPKLPADLRSKISATKKTHKGSKKSGTVASSLKFEYQGGTVEEAIEEANALFGLHTAERLNNVVFRPKLKQNDSAEERTTDELKAGEVKEIPSGFRTPTMSPQMASLHLKKCFSSPAMSDRSGKRKRYAEGKGLSVSLLNRTKEEKFALDLLAYQRNEKAFEHDLKRYWDRMGRPLKNLPTWQGEPVKLFTVFSAVNDRGGYNQVSMNKGGWQKVYQEATDTNTIKRGVKAKQFYLKYLLPFELYLHGKDYSEYLKYLKSADDKIAKRMLRNLEQESLSASEKSASVPPSTERRNDPSNCNKPLEQEESMKSAKRRRKGTPRHKPAASTMPVDEDVGFPYEFSTNPNLKTNLKSGTHFTSSEQFLTEYSDNSDEEWKQMEQMLRDIPSFTKRNQAMSESCYGDRYNQGNQNQDAGYVSQAASGNATDMTLKGNPDCDGSKVKVVFYGDDSPEFSQERTWLHRFDSDSELGSYQASVQDAQRVPSASKTEQVHVCASFSGSGSDDQVLHEMAALQDEIGEIHNQLMML